MQDLQLDCRDAVCRKGRGVLRFELGGQDRTGAEQRRTQQDIDEVRVLQTFASLRLISEFAGSPCASTRCSAQPWLHFPTTANCLSTRLDAANPL